jgi:hypothetical protein
MRMLAGRKGWAAIGAIAFAIASAGTRAADIGALTAKAAAAAKSGDLNASSEALEQALDAVRLEAPLALKHFTLVKEPVKYIGVYEPRSDATFRSGEQMFFYAEPKNLVYPRTAKGTYEPAYEVDLEVKGPDGKTMKKPQFANFRLASKARVEDVFVTMTLSLSGAAPGKYDVRFIVRDLNSKKSASVTQAITLK